MLQERLGLEKYVTAQMYSFVPFDHEMGLPRRGLA
jgi:hypothetical protein